MGGPNGRSSMNFSPRRDVVRTRASEFLGRWTDFSIAMLTLARKSGVSLILLILPTRTSATCTAPDFWRSPTSSKVAFTE